MCCHKNIVHLREIVCGPPEQRSENGNEPHLVPQVLFPLIHLVFDYIEFDLTALIDLARAGVSHVK